MKRQRTSAHDASSGKGSPKSGELPGTLVGQKGKQRRAKGGVKHSPKRQADVKAVD